MDRRTLQQTARILALAGCLVLASSAAARAAYMWASDDSGNIGRIDPTTGHVSGVFNPGVGAFTDIAFDRTGTLYGMSLPDTYWWGGRRLERQSLFRIDAANQNANRVESWWWWWSSPFLNSLVFDENNMGYTMGAESDRLYSIDLDSGNLSSIGQTGWYSDGDLEVIDGTLYLTGSQSSNGGDDTSSLVAIDPADGSATVRGDIGIDNVYGLAYMDNVLYATAERGIFPLNPATGTPLGEPVLYGGGFGTTWGATGPPVPEPGTLVLVAAGLLGLAAAGRHKRASGT